MEPTRRSLIAEAPARLAAGVRLCLTLLLALLCWCGARAEEKGQPLKVHLISGSAEDKSAASLSAFQKYLEANYNVVCTRSFGPEGGNDLPGLEALENSDVMVLFARRMKLPEAQLARLKTYCRSGKGIIGIRTAGQAFQNWLAFDKEVLGGSFSGQYKSELARVNVGEKVGEHPVLDGVNPFTTPGKLYKNSALSEDVELLLTAATSSHAEPVAWTRLFPRGAPSGRVVYTALGVPQDFKNANFRRLLVNAVFWAGNRTPEKR